MGSKHVSSVPPWFVFPAPTLTSFMVECNLGAETDPFLALIAFGHDISLSHSTRETNKDTLVVIQHSGGLSVWLLLAVRDEEGESEQWGDGHWEEGTGCRYLS